MQPNRLQGMKGVIVRKHCTLNNPSALYQSFKVLVVVMNEIKHIGCCFVKTDNSLLKCIMHENKTICYLLGQGKEGTGQF